ncbi:MAG: efflux RND transporter permease subunit, partial [Planctomycetes bacterium]|nr:efflux RND transporter permease subunit [Planctomycetota bacterium]
MKVVEVAIKRPALVTVGMILAALFGYISLTRIPVQLTPTIDRPEITVTTVYPGAAPPEVETEITDKLEEQLNAVESLREIRSSSAENVSSITLTFDWGTDKDLASIDILKRINLVGDLPDEAREPIIAAVSTDEAQAVMWLGLRGDPPVNVLREIANDQVRPRLERVTNVGRVRVFGGEEREIRIIVDYNKIASRQISVPQLRRALDAENRNVKGGAIDEGKRRYTLRTIGRFASLRDIENVIITKGPGGPVYVRDVAEVVDTYEDRTDIVRANGRPVVIMGAFRKTGSNTLEVSGGLMAEIARLKKELAPKGMDFDIYYDAAEYIEDSIAMVRRNLIIGALLACGVLVLFLRSLRSTLIVAISIPVALIASFVILNALGRSINVISLAGLTFASGMVVDNAIVVLDNIFRHLQQGKSALRAAYDGAVEVWGAVLAATLTTLAVFIAIIYVREEAGQIFKDIALTISCAVGLSLLVAMTVIPMLCGRWLSADGRQRRDGGRLSAACRKLPNFVGLGVWVRELFVNAVRWSTGRRRRGIAVVAVVVGGFLLSLLLLPPAEYLPTGNRNFMFGIVMLPPTLNINGADDTTRMIESCLAQVDELEVYFTVTSRLNIFFGGKAEKKHARRMRDIVGRIRLMLAGIPGKRFFNVSQASIFQRGFFSGKNVRIDVEGDDLQQVAAYAETVQNGVRRIPGVIFPLSSLSLGNPEIQLVVDRERAADLGLSSSEIAEAVEAVFGGRLLATEYRARGKEYDMLIRGSAEPISSRSELERMRITGQGESVNLLSVVEERPAVGPTVIEHTELRRSVTITAPIAESAALG